MSVLTFQDKKKIPITVYLHWVSFLIMQGRTLVLPVESALYFGHMRRVQTYPDWAAIISEIRVKFPWWRCLKMSAIELGYKNRKDYSSLLYLGMCLSC